MKRARVFRLAAALLLALGFRAAAAAEPGASDWVSGEAGAVRLVSGVSGSGDLAVLPLGLHFRLEPGWKIYWRTPGDAGYPPKLDWAGSDNAGDARISWPAPKRFELAGLQNHGYAGEVVLPVSLAVPRPGEPVSLALRVDYLACSEICVPIEARLALALPVGESGPTPFVHDIGRFAALVPGDGARHGLTLVRAEASGEGKDSLLRVEARADPPFEHPDMFVEAEGVAGFDKPRIRLSDGGRTLLAEMPVVPGTLERPLAGAGMALTIVDGMRSMQASISPEAASAGPRVGAGAEASAGLAAMLGLALLGGLILNLMPCVLPVLSIKVLGVLGHGGAERAHVRASFLASAAGIVVSFLALAGAAIAVKAAGAAVGWGIQFQQPVFLAAMTVLLALFAANLWGFYEIPMPSWLMVGKGVGKGHHTLLGHFLSGAFATLLATPCSAPFLGTAVGFALARGPAEIGAIFAALGIGMASPFLLMAVRPDFARRLPRPGAWMVRLRVLLGMALAGTALWLLTVLAVQISPPAILVTGVALGGMLLLLAGHARLPHGARRAAMAAAGGLALLALAAPLGSGPAAGGGVSASSFSWVGFERDSIPRLVAEGKVVLVDVTADWCITCKVNKAAVLERGEVASRLAAPPVVAMRADWTSPDDSIAAFLADHGRYGIPFNIVFGPSAPEGIALSELLTEAEVLSALDAAEGRAARP